MTLRTSCSKTAMLRKTISRFWPLWLGYLLVLLLTLPMGLYNNLQYDMNIKITNVQSYIYDVTEASAVYAFLMAPISAMCVFSHLYNDRHTGAYASLPVKRENMFLSCTLAGLIPQLLAGLITTAVTFGVESFYGATDATSTLTFIGVFCLHTITFYGFAVLCAQLTGAILVVPAVYGVLQFTALAVQAVAQSLLELFLYGYTYSSLDAGFLSPLVHIMNSTRYSVAEEITLADGSTQVAAWGFEGWGVCAIYAVSGLAFLVLSFFLYRRRRMESAGDFVAVRPLKPVFKWALGGGCGLVLSYILIELFHSSRTDTILGMNNAAASLLFLLTGGFIGFFGAEMLMKKTFRVFDKKAFKGFALFAAVTALLLGCLVFDFFGYETRMPKLENVQSVSLYATGDIIALSDTENLEKVLHLHQGTLAVKQENAAAQKENWQNQNYSTHYFTITYGLKNGRVINRRYHLCDTGRMLGVLGEVEDVMNSREAITSRIPDTATLTADSLYHGRIYYDIETKPLSQQDGIYAPAFEAASLSLSPAEAYDLYINCILPDMYDCTIATINFTDSSPYFSKKYEGSIDLEFYLRPQRDADEYARTLSCYTFIPTVNSHRTNQWLADHGINMLLQDYVNQQYEKAEVLNMNPNSFPEDIITASSVGIIGGADGPTSIVVSP